MLLLDSEDGKSGRRGEEGTDKECDASHVTWESGVETADFIVLKDRTRLTTAYSNAMEEGGPEGRDKDEMR